MARAQKASSLAHDAGTWASLTVVAGREAINPN